jgi:hypothetical protein
LQLREAEEREAGGTGRKCREVGEELPGGGLRGYGVRGYVGTWYVGRWVGG